MPLNEGQQRAADLVFGSRSRIAIITGGPGTGKTYTVKSIVDRAVDLGWRVAGGAPTGAAAKRASSMSGHPFSTLHRLLAFHPENGFQRNEKNPLEADLVIVDETSMVDEILFVRLLRALSCRLLLVGDKDQLPSVGAGRVFGDLIVSGAVPVAHLTQVMRQDERSAIHRNAQRINAGEMPVLDHYGFEDFFWVEVEDKADIAGRMLHLIEETFPVAFPENKETGRPYDPLTDFMVLAPMHGGPCGVAALNDTLRDAFNPQIYQLLPMPTAADREATELVGCVPEIKHGSYLYRLGDRVIANVNDYKRDVFNGDGGIIVDIDGRTLSVDYGRGEIQIYDKDDLTSLQGKASVLPDFCRSIHKSQGSEALVVLLSIHSTHSIMLARQLLYTGITRVRHKVFIFGDKKGLERAVRNESPVQRYTALAEMLGRAA